MKNLLSRTTCIWKSKGNVLNNRPARICRFLRDDVCFWLFLPVFRHRHTKNDLILRDDVSCYCESRILFVYHAVLKLCKLGAVPTACCSYEVAGDTLELVNLGALAMRAFLEVCISVFISAVKTSVAVVVY